MKISDLKEEEIHIGMKVRSLTNPNKIGTIVSIEKERDHFTWILWNAGTEMKAWTDSDTKNLSGFFGNDCECEIVE